MRGRGGWIAEGIGMKLQTVCGRCNELLGGKDGEFPRLIYQTDESRGGSKVLKVI